MENLLSTLGGIAGIGGLALGVFLLLFRRIRLPEAESNHITLLMWLSWSICVLGLTIYLIGIFISSPNGDNSSIEEWHNNISVTRGDNQDLVDILHRNSGKIIYISSHIDMSLSSYESYENATPIGYSQGSYSNSRQEVMELGASAVDRFQNDSSLSIPLDGIKASTFLQLKLLNDRNLNVSYGGTGVIQFPISGFFRVEPIIHSGPRVTFVLNEVPENVSRNF